MVGGKALILADQRRAALIRQLFDMPFHRDTQRGGGLEEAFGLRRGKADVFTKHVDCFI